MPCCLSEQLWLRARDVDLIIADVYDVCSGQAGYEWDNSGFPLEI